MFSARPDPKSSTSRPSRLRRLRRLRERSPRSPLSRSRRFTGWVSALLVVVVVGSVGFLALRRYVAQRLDVERIARAQLVPLLEKSLGRKVEIGRVETDYRSRVIVHDIVIGRDSQSPVGAVARAESATIDLDLFALALGRTDAASALSRIVVQRPEIWLRRDAQGHINLLETLSGSSNKTLPKLNFTLEIQSGRIWLEDEKTRSSRGVRLALDARQVTGSAIVATTGTPNPALAPLSFQLASPSVLMPRENTQLRAVTLSGLSGLDGKRLELRLGWSDASAPIFLSYAPQRTLTATAGALDGTATLEERGSALNWRADVRARNLAGSSPLLRDPRDGKPLQIADASGPLALDAHAVRFAGFSARVPSLDTRLLLDGAATLNGARVDVRARSERADTTRWMALARAFAPTARESLNLTGGLARADVRIKRSGGQVSAMGRVTIPNVRWQGGNRAPVAGVFASPQGVADFKVLLAAGTTRAAGTVRFSSASWRGQKGEAGGAGNSTVNFRLLTNPRQTQWQAEAQLPGLNARQPNTGAANIGLLDVSLRGQSGGGRPLSRIGVRFAAQDARLNGLSGASRGQFQTAAANGVANWRTVNGRALAATNLDLGRWSLTSAQYGTAQGSTAQLRTSEFDPARPVLSGELHVTGTEASGLQAVRAALNNGPLRSIGPSEVRVRFAGLDPAHPKNATARGTFQLSAVRLQAGGEDLDLREVAGAASYGNGRLRLAGARAQTPFGLASADADVDTTGEAAPRFAVTLSPVRVPPQLAQRLLPAGMRLPAGTTGRVRLASVAAGTNAAGNNYALDFDFALPGLNVRLRDQSGRPLEARAENAHLRGRGLVSLSRPVVAAPGAGAAAVGSRSAQSQWQFAGEAVAAAPDVRLASVTESVPSAILAVKLPGWMRGTRLHGVRVRVTGQASPSGSRLAGAWATSSGELPLPQGTNTLQIADARGRVALVPGGFELPRLALRVAGGSVAGQLALQDGNLNGDLLAQRLDVPMIARLAGSGAAGQGAVTGGMAWARVRLVGRADAPGARVELRIHDTVLRSEMRRLPVDNLEADFDLDGPNFDLVPVRRLLVWSRGARLEASGSLRRANGRVALDLQTQLAGLRAREVALQVGAGDTALSNADADGLLGFAGRVTGDAGRPHLEGRVSLRAARAYGLQMPEATADADAIITSRGPRVTLANFVARVAGLDGESRAEGEGAVDIPGGEWRLKLTAHDVQASRLAQTARSRLDRQLNGRVLPVRGTLGGEVDLRGRIEDRAGRLKLIPVSGTVNVRSGPLRWRDRPIGALRADLNIENGVARAQTLEIRAEDATGGNATFARLTGALPLTPDAPGLDATFDAEGGRASVLIAALKEARDFFARKEVAPESPPPDQPPPPANDDEDLNNPIRRVLAEIVRTTVALPGLEANASAQAHITNTWRKPVVEVNQLRLTQVSARTPEGAVRPLPEVDLAFTYDAPSGGEIHIQRADLRLHATGPNADEDDDTLLRVDPNGRILPGGKVELSARVLNANLSQLAPWVPALQDEAGNPLLRGELDQFTLRVGGTAQSPELSGFIQARNLDYRGYTLDRLRLSNFHLGDGEFRVQPGDLTVAKGSFQSSVGSGSVPWDWSIPGPRRDGPLQVELPLAKDDFGAIIGVLAPAVQVADASEFNGVLRVGGTINQPQLSGQLRIRNGRMRVDPVALPLDAGILDLSGSLAFSGDSVQIDADDPLRGRIVPASEVEGGRGASTGNLPTERRAPPRQPAPARSGIVQASTNSTGNREAGQPRTSGAALSAKWELRGRVQLDTANILNPRELAAASRYDLTLGVRDAMYSRQGFGGVRNGLMAMVWRTGDGPAAENQHLGWIFAAEGSQGSQGSRALPGQRRRSNGGQVYSTGALHLRPGFAQSLNSLGRGQIEQVEAAQLQSLPVWNLLPAELRANLQPRLEFKAFHFDLQNAGAGDITGVLKLDNETATAPNPLRIAPLHPVSMERDALPPSSRREAPYRFFATPETGAGSPPVDQLEGTDPGTILITPKAAPETPEERRARPVRLSGTLIITDAQMVGVPESGEAVGTGFELPNTPAFDVHLQLGQNVGFSTATLRAPLVGELTLTGTPRSPILSGTLETRGGQARFPGANVRLISGELQVSAFRDPETGELRAQANIDAVARGRAGQYTVELTIRGPLNISERDVSNNGNLSVTITTNPPLSQNEAFARLLGTSTPGTREAGERASQAYAQAVVSLLSAPLFSGIERSLEQALGLSNISVDYRLNEPIAVEIGKALGDRVYISYRRELTGNRPGEPVPYTVRVEFRIHGDIQLGLQTDERERRQITLQKTWRF